MKINSTQFILFFLIISFNCSAQTEFWGVSRNGGTQGFGSIFKTDNRGEFPVSIYSFSDTVNGIHPEGSLYQAMNRKLYGTTKYGGIHNMGTIFEFDIFSNSFSKIADFDSVISGCYPSGNILRLQHNTWLYGMTGYGGANNMGVLYGYNLNTDTLIKFLDFDSAFTGGNSENGSIQFAIDSSTSGFHDYRFLVSTAKGGANNQGVIFKYDYNSDAILQRADIPPMSGSSSERGDLLEISTSTYLGMSSNGGASFSGYIYEYNRASNTIAHKISFNSTTGTQPLGTLVKGINGKYYGLTSSGGAANTGTLFEYDYLGNSFTRIIDFGILLSNISEPHGSLLHASNDKLYGMGTNGVGCATVLFEYDYILDQLIEKSNLCSTITAVMPVYSTLIEVDSDSTRSVWPGDCNYDLVVDNIDFLYLGVAFGDTGAQRNPALINYVAQPCPQWQTAYSYNGLIQGFVNAKNMDCDGNGIVDSLDAAAIYLNYGKTHVLRRSSDGNQISSHDNMCLIPVRSPVAPGDPVDFEILIGGQTAPVDYLYGIAFSLHFDPIIVDTNRISLDFSNSLLGTPGVDMMIFQKNDFASGVIHLALVRKDHLDYFNPGGLLGIFRVYSWNGISSITDLTVVPNRVNCVKANGSRFLMGKCFVHAVIDPSLTNINNEFDETKIVFYPNPASDKITIDAGSEKINEVELYDAGGKKVFTVAPSVSVSTLPMENFNSGFYFLRVITNRQVFTGSFQIMR